jgi:hypothetical protein
MMALSAETLTSTQPNEETFTVDFNDFDFGLLDNLDKDERTRHERARQRFGRAQDPSLDWSVAARMEREAECAMARLVGMAERRRELRRAAERNVSRVPVAASAHLLCAGSRPRAPRSPRRRRKSTSEARSGPSDGEPPPVARLYGVTDAAPHRARHIVSYVLVHGEAA